MRIAIASGLTLALVLVTAAFPRAQGDPDRVIPGGGVFVQGWTGKIDASSMKQGRTLNDAKLAQEGNAIHITTGPAVTYWNPANTASGDYTVKATFREPKFMNLNSHPHSYGIFIGGRDMGTDQMSLVYCVAYGNGNALIRGFAPAVFTLMRPSPSPSVNKAPAVDQPVTQEIAWRVKGNRAECVVNGGVVAGYDKSELVSDGKIKSTDGVYGIRITHNVEAIVTGFGMTKE